MWGIGIPQLNKTIWRRPRVSFAWLRQARHYEKMPRLLQLLYKRLAAASTQLKLSIPLFQDRCTARGCTARLPGPSTHTRKHTDALGTRSFTINDRLCDAHVLQLWDDVVALDALVHKSRRVRIDETGDGLEVECGASFVEEESEMVQRVSTAEDGDFSDVESWDDGEEWEEWDMRF